MAAQTAETENTNNNNLNLNERKVSWAKLQRVDSLNLEAGRLSFSQSHGSKVNWKVTLSLAFQSLGVIYGDIGTSPLYVYSSTFTEGKIENKQDLLGVFSLIIYTIILVPLIKYISIVLWANDNGDGGTFALYSLICRYAKVSLVPNQMPEDRELSNYRLENASNVQLKRAQMIKHKIETSKTLQLMLFLVTILGTSLVIGDGILTPCISVLSAVSGIKSLKQDAVVWVSIAILVLIFSVQRFGTDKVGYSFAPIICLWYTFIGGIGLYNLFKYDITVLRAFNPQYIVEYFQRNGKKGWISLGGVFLAITGTEAMFADLGHFNVRAVQISFSGTVFPGLLTAYAGQAAYLVKFPDEVGNTFYASVPDPLYWPTFVVAVAAAIIASQALISGVYSIVAQSLSLGCFPRVKVIHTSDKYEGQVYIPEINYVLMIACIIVTLAFRTTEKLGNAYGIAVVLVMIITTCLVTLIMLVIWKTSIWWIALFVVVFLSIELVYFSAVMYKFTQGGFFPMAFAAVLMMIMGTWHYVHKERYIFELKNKFSSEFIRDLARNPNISRVPGIGLLYSELVQGIPPIFSHFIANMPSIHSVLVFVSVKSIPISKVAAEERFLFRQVGPREYRMFRCVVRYGYNDAMEKPGDFEHQLVQHLKQFIRDEQFICEGGPAEQITEAANVPRSTLLVQDAKAKESSTSTVHIEESFQQQNPVSSVSSRSIQSFRAANSATSSGRIISGPIQGAEEEIMFVQKAMEHGVVYLLGEAEVRALPNSSLFKKIVVNYAYNFLRKNSRQGDRIMAIPRGRLLRVGMTYEI